MADTVVTIGPVTLADMEIPASIPWGGAQAHTVHKLLGGARIVDSLGADDMDLKWSARFQGSNALDRAILLDQMRRDGQQVTLTWGGLSYQVLISEFTADFQRIYQLPYSITCVVVSASALSPASSTATLDDLVDGDMADAEADAATIDDPTVLPAINGLQDAITAVQTAQGALQGASLTTLGPVSIAATSAITTINTVLGDLDGATFTDAGSVAGVIAGQFAPTSIANFVSQAGLIEQQANLQGISSLIGRVQKNLAQATG